MDHTKLKKIATSIFDVPSHLPLTIEDYFEEKEAYFVWEVGMEEGVSIRLDSEGRLLALHAFLHDSELPEISLEERIEIAKAFLDKHYGKELARWTLVKQEAGYLEFCPVIMEIPIEDAGVTIRVNKKGIVTDVSYRPLEVEPKIPTYIAPKEQVLTEVKKDIQLKLSVASIIKEIHLGEVDRLALVYEWDGFYRSIPVDGSKVDQIMEEESQVILDSPAPTNKLMNWSVEELIGITPDLEKIREGDMEDVSAVVWRKAGFEEKEGTLSVDDYFHNRAAETVKAKFDKKTGRLQGFLWFMDCDGNVDLSSQECLQLAVDYIQAINPELLENFTLKLVERESVNTEKQLFHFEIFLKNTSLQLPTMLGVNVNKKTGRVCFYSGVDIDLKAAAALQTKPPISMEEAVERISKSLDIELKWKIDYDEDEKSYKLVYKFCDKESGKPIRYVDAVSGELILAERD